MLLLPAPSFGGGDAMPPQGLSLFSAPKFAGLFLAFFQLQSLEQAVVLNLFFQNAHGLFKVIFQHLDLDIFQPVSPLYLALEKSVTQRRI